MLKGHDKKSNISHNRKKIASPLWIISLFVALTEGIAGVGLIQTAGAVQIILTVFVVTFPTIVAIAFFVILWERPYVFYPPTEFGDTPDVSKYVFAMRQNVIENTRSYQHITSVVKETLTSPESLSMFGAQHLEQNESNNIRKILTNLSNATIGKIKNNIITIDSKPFLKEYGIVWEQPYDPNQSIWFFLDTVWYIVADNIPPYTYDKKWILRDKSSGVEFRNIGRLHAISKGKNEDRRTVYEVGINCGSTLELIEA